MHALAPRRFVRRKARMILLLLSLLLVFPGSLFIFLFFADEQSEQNYPQQPSNKLTKTESICIGHNSLLTVVGLPKRITGLYNRRSNNRTRPYNNIDIKSNSTPLSADHYGSNQHYGDVKVTLFAAVSIDNKLRYCRRHNYTCYIAKNDGSARNNAEEEQRGRQQERQGQSDVNNDSRIFKLHAIQKVLQMQKHEHEQQLQQQQQQQQQQRTVMEKKVAQSNVGRNAAYTFTFTTPQSLKSSSSDSSSPTILYPQQTVGPSVPKPVRQAIKNEKQQPQQQLQQQQQHDHQTIFVDSRLMYVDVDTLFLNPVEDILVEAAAAAATTVGARLTGKRNYGQHIFLQQEEEEEEQQHASTAAATSSYCHQHATGSSESSGNSSTISMTTDLYPYINRFQTGVMFMRHMTMYTSTSSTHNRSDKTTPSSSPPSSSTSTTSATSSTSTSPSDVNDLLSSVVQLSKKLRKAGEKAYNNKYNRNKTALLLSSSPSSTSTSTTAVASEDSIFNSDQKLLNILLEAEHDKWIEKSVVFNVSKARFNAFPVFKNPMWTQMGLPIGDESDCYDNPPGRVVDANMAVKAAGTADSSKQACSLVTHFAGQFGGLSITNGLSEPLASLIVMEGFLHRALQFLVRNAEFDSNYEKSQLEKKEASRHQDQGQAHNNRKKILLKSNAEVQVIIRDEMLPVIIDCITRVVEMALIDEGDRVAQDCLLAYEMSSWEVIATDLRDELLLSSTSLENYVIDYRWNF